MIRLTVLFIVFAVCTLSLGSFASPDDYPRRHSSHSRDGKRTHDDDAKMLVLLGKNYPQAKQLTMRANQLYQGCESEQAIEAYDQAIKLCPKYARAFLGRGRADADLKRFDLAFNDFKQAALFNPHCAYDALVASWQLHLSRKEYAAAVADMDLLLKINPDKSVQTFVYTRRGQSFLELGNAPEALKDSDRCLALHQTSVRGWMLRAQACEKLNKSADAIVAYDNVLKYTSQGKSEDRLRTPGEDPLRVLKARAALYDRIGKHDLATRDRQAVSKMEHEDFDYVPFRAKTR